MNEDVVSKYLLRKLRSNLEEAGKEGGRSSWMVSRFRSLEEQISEKSSVCRIPENVLYDVIGALSGWRVFSYQRPALSKKVFFYLFHVLRHPRLERRMSKRLNDIAEEVRNLCPANNPLPSVVVPRPRAQSETTKPISDHSDIIGFEEEVAKIVEWLRVDTFTDIAIVGEWGCGKTALAQKVFALPTMKQGFSPLIWVCLSGKMPEEQETVVNCIKEKIGHDVRDGLNGKRYLMVLDDAWWTQRLDLDLDLPKGSGGALILTTRCYQDVGTDHNHVIRLEPKLKDETCRQIFYQTVNQQGKLDQADPLLTAIQNDATRNSRGRPLAVKTLGLIIPDLLLQLQRKHWIRARDLKITWAGTSKYWKWSRLGPPEETDEVAELVNVCWLEIWGRLKMNMMLFNKTYSAYLVYKLKEQRYNLHIEMKARVTIGGKPEPPYTPVYIDGDRSGAEAEDGRGWLKIKLGDFCKEISDHGSWVEARFFHNGPWKSGLVVKGISFRLNNN